MGSPSICSQESQQKHPLLFGNPNPGIPCSYAYIIHTRLSHSKEEDSVIYVLQMTHHKGFWTQGETAKNIFPYAPTNKKTENILHYVEQENGPAGAPCAWGLSKQKKVDGNHW